MQLGFQAATDATCAAERMAAMAAKGASQLMLLSLGAATSPVPQETAPPVQMPTRADMEGALARSDMVWEWNSSVPASLPQLWTEAPFVGNGMVGAYITVDKRNSELNIEVSRADYWDVRMPGTKYYANRSYLDTPRLPGGYLTLRAPAGATITSGAARVHLANASLTMQLVVTGSSGQATTLTLAAAALADRPSMLLLEGSALNGYLNLSFTNRVANGNRGKDPTPNPPAECAPHSAGGIEVCKQDLIAGGGFAAARKLDCHGNNCTLLMALTNSVPAAVKNKDDASVLATADVVSAQSVGVAALKAAHTAWWLDGFWPRSMLSVPDAVVESFVWIQLYKVGSATRCDGPENCWAMDLAMPWYVPIGRWHDYHWDLNVQMSYWVVLPSNHARLGKSLVAQMKRNLPFLISSVPAIYQNDSAAQAANTGFEGRASCDSFLLNKSDCLIVPSDKDPVQLGDLPWVAHNLWWQYRYTLDPEDLETCVAVLKRSIGYYLRLMSRDTHGKLHLPIAESPEYANAQDTNYDLALFRWGVGVLMHLAVTDMPSLKSEPAYAQWQTVAKDLTAFPTEPEQGLLIGQGVPLSHGHRHWSHLFSIFPTTLLNPGPSSLPANISTAAPSAMHSELALDSLDHYAAMNGAEKFIPSIQNGFPRAAISTMSGMAGRPDAAYRNLSNWFLSTSAANDGYGGGSFGQNLGPNTMYQEAGGAPCNESPLGAAFAIQSWLLSCWSFGAPEIALKTDALRVFPAVPQDWASSISIGSLSAEGGYNVSAQYTAGKTIWIHVTATAAGRKRSVELYTDMAKPLVVTPKSVVATFLRKEGAQNVFSLTLQPSQAVLLQPAGATPATSVKVAPVAWPKLNGSDVENYWGKHQRKAFPPMPPPPPPPPPRPHPQPSPPVTCSGDSVVGYTCYEHHCAADDNHTGSCGTDLCHPDFKKPPPTDPATVALCMGIPSGPNATNIAVARCNSFKGCTTVARSPLFHNCRGEGVCFKYFSSGKAGLTVDSSWTAWIKNNGDY